MIRVVGRGDDYILVAVCLMGSFSAKCSADVVYQITGMSNDYSVNICLCAMVLE